MQCPHPSTHRPQAQARTFTKRKPFAAYHPTRTKSGSLADFFIYKPASRRKKKGPCGSRDSSNKTCTSERLKTGYGREETLKRTALISAPKNVRIFEERQSLAE
jgi:hypothetical protein